jgi:hypothetical protein
MLKQIKKNNEVTNKNLEILLSRTENDNNKNIELTLDQINLFTFVDNFKLSIKCL